MDGFYHTIHLPGRHLGMIFTNLVDERQQLLLFLDLNQHPIQVLMEALLSDSYCFIKLIHFDRVFFPVRPKPSDTGVEIFFFMSTPNSSPASAISLSKKSIWICYFPTICSNSFICCFKVIIFRVSLKDSNTSRSCFFFIREYR